MVIYSHILGGDGTTSVSSINESNINLVCTGSASWGAGTVPWIFDMEYTKTK